MVRIAVVDDEQNERDTLVQYFGQLEQELTGALEVRTFSSGEALLDSFDYSYDLITLDIDMDGRDGIHVAKEIRRLDENVVILFITNMAQMAIQGYEVRALDFIVKPVTYYSFAMKMASAISIIQNKKSRNIVLTTPTGIVKFSTNDLYYAEVTGHTLIYHTSRGQFQQKEPLSLLEESLKDFSFKRCNNCYLINLKYVDSISKDMLLINGAWLKISRPRKKEFLQALAKYMGGGRL